MNLQELLKQKEELDRQIAAVKSKSREEAIATVRKLMADNGLTAADLVEVKGKRAGSTAKGRTVAAKYRDADGNSWTGRGLKPKWLTQALAGGKKIEDFTV